MDYREGLIIVNSKGAARSVAIVVAISSACLTGQTSQKTVSDARAVLRSGVESSDPKVRVQAIQAVGLIGISDEVRGKLEDSLKDGNIQVRIAAIKTLADLKSTGSIPILEKLLQKDDVPEVQFAAAKTLFRFHDEKGTQWLEELYNGSRTATSSALTNESRKFFGNFHSLESAATFIVSEGVGYVPVPGVGEGFSAVTGLIADPDLSPRAGALMLLVRDAGPESEGLLKKALADKDWSVRAVSTQMIAYTGRASLREDLTPLFKDKNDKVRFRAAGAYLHFALIARSAGPAQ